MTSRPARDVVIAGRQAITAEWWNEQRYRFELYISAIVESEAEVGDPDAVRRRMDALNGIAALKFGETAKSLAHKLTHDGPMPSEYPEDALHIAICALSGIDYMLTWNCSHMANATMRRQVEEFLEAEGYVCPIICTPEELMEE